VLGRDLPTPGEKTHLVQHLAYRGAHIGRVVDNIKIRDLLGWISHLASLNTEYRWADRFLASIQIPFLFPPFPVCGRTKLQKKEWNRLLEGARRFPLILTKDLTLWPVIMKEGTRTWKRETQWKKRHFYSLITVKKRGTLTPWLKVEKVRTQLPVKSGTEGTILTLWFQWKREATFFITFEKMSTLSLWLYKKNRHPTSLIIEDKMHLQSLITKEKKGALTPWL
jgi:hypothetical protein